MCCSVCCPYMCKMCVWTTHVYEAHVREEGCEIRCVCSVRYAGSVRCVRYLGVWCINVCGLHV